MDRRHSRKAQSSIMEYLLMSFFVLMVIIALIFFLTWFQFSQLGMEQQSIKNQRLLTLMDRISNSMIFVDENSVFDDAKLMSLVTLGGGVCDDLDDYFGSEWSIEIESLTPDSGHSGPCEVLDDYPECSSWSIVCGIPGERNVSRVLPVNVYRKISGRTELGLLKVGVYS